MHCAKTILILLTVDCGYRLANWERWVATSLLSFCGLAAAIVMVELVGIIVAEVDHRDLFPEQRSISRERPSLLFAKDRGLFFNYDCYV